LVRQRQRQRQRHREPLLLPTSSSSGRSMMQTTAP
jgi:hypothetical protein